MGPRQVRCKAFQCDSTGKKIDAIDGVHVLMAAIPSEKGHIVRWIFVERYDGFAETEALKVFPMSTARAASLRHTEHGHHNITEILDATKACFHTDVDELIHAHLPRETEPDCIVVWLLFKAHSGASKACTFF